MDKITDYRTLHINDVTLLIEFSYYLLLERTRFSFYNIVKCIIKNYYLLVFIFAKMSLTSWTFVSCDYRLDWLYLVNRQHNWRAMCKIYLPRSSIVFFSIRYTHRCDIIKSTYGEVANENVLPILFETVLRESLP